ncbi:MAG: phosphate/phosphite/phosphonate ABC transporter substrate-binding protein [Burkholderiaceae bacterium]|nr:phosphate/phosphite/phosphonate ABC transporter substrate-binding protein [Burkholderiaceae bacterium]
MVATCLLSGLAPAPAAAAEVLSFGVLSQRSAVLTAQYWNPIFDYVERRTGVKLMLKIARSAPESNDEIEKGSYDFVYSNSIFLPRMAQADYQVILRPCSAAITGQIVTLRDSPLRSLSDLQGKELGFPSADAVLGHAVPMDHLLREGIVVTPVYGANQEGIMGQLKAGRVLAAGVNSELMKTFAARENIAYRVLWESQPFYNLPIAVHPRVPKGASDAVRKAIDAMEDDPEGLRILKAASSAVGQKAPYGFCASGPSDYQNYVVFYKNALLKEKR